MRNLLKVLFICLFLVEHVDIITREKELQNKNAIFRKKLRNITKCIN